MLRIKKLLSLTRSHLFTFYFHCSGRRNEKGIVWFTSKSVLPMFSSKSFIVLGLTFRSWIHFEFIFVNGVRKCSNFLLLHVAVQFSQHHLLKRLSFLHNVLLTLFGRLSVGVWVYLWAFSLVPLIYTSVFVPVQYCVNCCYFVL